MIDYESQIKKHGLSAHVRTGPPGSEWGYDEVRLTADSMDGELRIETDDQQISLEPEAAEELAHFILFAAASHRASRARA